MLRHRIVKFFLKNADIRDIYLDQNPGDCGTDCGGGWLTGYSGYDNIKPFDAYEYYASVEPLRDSIDKISDASAGLPLAISFKGDSDLITDHEILNKISSPGDEVNKTNLLKELVMSSMLTNEAWLILRGNVESKPSGMSYVRPYNINVHGMYDTDGYPTIIKTDSPRDKRTYFKENTKGRIRYIDKLRLNELCPIIGTVELREQFRGLSQLTSIKEELEQIRGGNAHNSSFLKRGMFPAKGFQADPAGIKETGRSLPDKKQMDDFSKSLEKKFAGAGKSGGNIVFPFPVKVEDFSVNNKDADYLGLIGAAETRIYNQYGIPLALISEKAMTLDNYTTALVAFYDNAVVDGTTNVFNGIARCLRDRYKEKENMAITFNPHEVKALQGRLVDRMVELRKSQVLTTDEIRKTAGYEATPNGEKVLVDIRLKDLNDLEEEEPVRFPDEI